MTTTTLAVVAIATPALAAKLGVSFAGHSSLASPVFRCTSCFMSVAKITEISAQSPKSFDDAVRDGITRASATIRNIESAWIKEQQVIVDGQGQIKNYRVTMKLTFILDD